MSDTAEDYRERKDRYLGTLEPPPDPPACDGDDGEDGDDDEDGGSGVRTYHVVEMNHALPWLARAFLLAGAMYYGLAAGRLLHELAKG